MHTVNEKIYVALGDSFASFTPPDLSVNDEDNGNHVQHGWQPTVEDQHDYLLLDMNTQSQYLDMEFPEGLPLPLLHKKSGLILSGKIPNWLLVAAARQLASDYDWLAVYQPQLNGYVVVAHNDSERIGEILPRDN